MSRFDIDRVGERVVRGLAGRPRAMLEYSEPRATACRDQLAGLSGPAAA